MLKTILFKQFSAAEYLNALSLPHITLSDMYKRARVFSQFPN